MTLTEIMVAALSRLERGTDTQTIARHRDNFVLYANKAIRMISDRYRPCRKQTVNVTNSTITIADFDREPIRINKVLVADTEVYYEQTYDGSGVFEIDYGNATAATADVIYRFAPAKISNSKDVPELPAYMHDIIVNYIVACVRAGGDPSTQASSSVDFQMFNQQLMDIKPSTLGQPSSKVLKNYY